MIESVFNTVIYSSLAAVVLGMTVRVAETVPFVRRQAELRHCLWVLVLLQFVAPAIVDLKILPGGLSSQQLSGGHRTDTPWSGKRSDSHHDSRGLIGDSASRAGIVEWRAVVIGVSAAGTGIFSLLVGRQRRLLRRIIAVGHSKDPRVEVIGSECAEAFGLVHRPRFIVAAGRISPLLYVSGGLPTIVLPRHLVDEFTDDELRCVVSHEIAHFLRRDERTNVLALLIAGCFWWHPLVWIARRRMRMAQEACCDALVLREKLAARDVYAAAVLKTLEFMQAERSLLPVWTSSFGGTSLTLRRFQMIASSQVSYRLSWWHIPVLLGCALVLVCRAQAANSDVPLASAAILSDAPAAEDDETEGESGEDDGDDEQEKPVKLEDLPEPVHETLMREAQGGEIEELEQETENGRVIYCADVEFEKNGKELLYDIEIAEDGTLLRKVLEHEEEDDDDDDQAEEPDND